MPRLFLRWRLTEFVCFRAAQNATGSPCRLRSTRPVRQRSDSGEPFKVGHAAQQPAYGDLAFHPGRWRSQAKVNSLAECQVFVSLRVVSNESGLANCIELWSAAAMTTSTICVLGMSWPLNSTSSRAKRSVGVSTGPS